WILDADLDQVKAECLDAIDQIERSIGKGRNPNERAGADAHGTPPRAIFLQLDLPDRRRIIPTSGHTSRVQAELRREERNTASINRMPDTPSATPGTKSEAASGPRPSICAQICSARSA